MRFAKADSDAEKGKSQEHGPQKLNIGPNAQSLAGGVQKIANDPDKAEHFLDSLEFLTGSSLKVAGSSTDAGSNPNQILLDFSSPEANAKTQQNLSKIEQAISDIQSVIGEVDPKKYRAIRAYQAVGRNK